MSVNVNPIYHVMYTYCDYCKTVNVEIMVVVLTCLNWLCSVLKSKDRVTENGTLHGFTCWNGCIFCDAVFISVVSING